MTRKQKYSFGRWQVMRERAQIPDPAPPPGFEKTAHVSSVVQDVLGKLGLEEAVWLRRLEDEWERVVGAAVAKHARPGRWEGRRLVVYVDSSAWLSELERYFKDKILHNIRCVPGCEKVCQVSFSLDPEARRGKDAGT